MAVPSLRENQGQQSVAFGLALVRACAIEAIGSNESLYDAVDKVYEKSPFSPNQILETLLGRVWLIPLSADRRQIG
jgi:hypothetical protein